MKTLTRATLIIALLFGGFAVGFSLGDSQGFTRGGEWALVQAGIVAREEGLNMPVSFTNGAFEVVQKQPADLYKKAWQMADRRYDEDMRNMRKSMTAQEAVNAATGASYKTSRPRQRPQGDDEQLSGFTTSLR